MTRYLLGDYRREVTLRNYHTFEHTFVFSGIVDGQALADLLSVIVNLEIPEPSDRQEIFTYFSSRASSAHLFPIFLNAPLPWLITALQLGLDSNVTQFEVPVLYLYLQDTLDNTKKWERVRACLQAGFQVVRMKDDVYEGMMRATYESDDTQEELRDFINLARQGLTVKMSRKVETHASLPWRDLVRFCSEQTNWRHLFPDIVKGYRHYEKEVYDLELGLYTERETYHRAVKLLEAVWSGQPAKEYNSARIPWQGEKISVKKFLLGAKQSWEEEKK